jgi:hypothetical protein
LTFVVNNNERSYKPVTTPKKSKKIATRIQESSPDESDDDDADPRYNGYANALQFIQNGNEHGQVANNQLANGQVANGQLANGQVANGLLANFEVVNGQVENGHGSFHVNGGINLDEIVLVSNPNFSTKKCTRLLKKR